MLRNHDKINCKTIVILMKNFVVWKRFSTSTRSTKICAFIINSLWDFWCISCWESDRPSFTRFRWSANTRLILWIFIDESTSKYFVNFETRIKSNSCFKNNCDCWKNILIRLNRQVRHQTIYLEVRFQHWQRDH